MGYLDRYVVQFIASFVYFFTSVSGRNGVLEDVLRQRTHFEVFGLEAHKSSKMSYSRLEDSTFFVSLKMSHGQLDMTFFFTLLGKSAKTSRKIWKEFFFSEGRLKKILGDFFWGGERSRLVFLASRSLSLALASDFFVSLASKVASSTSPLHNSKIRFRHLFYYL